MIMIMGVWVSALNGDCQSLTDMRKEQVLQLEKKN